MNTQSSLMKDIRASTSWRFQASLKAARVLVVTGGLAWDMVNFARVFEAGRIGGLGRI
jgi:hypothetical protein